MAITDQIDEFLEIFPTMHKDVADLIYQVINWDDQKKAAFKIAKRIFEDGLDGTEENLSEV